jgi:hypothetical protein
MPQVDTPWVGLAALVAMFVIPFLPNWLFEGPRTIRHRPKRHVCGDCGVPWTHRHACGLDEPEDARPLKGQIRRVTPTRALVPRRRSVERIGNS